MASPPTPRPPKTIRTAQDASKTPRTRLFFGICFSMPFLIDFWLILHPNLPPKTSQNWSKIYQKSMPRGTPSWTPFFDRFLIDFWSIFRPPEPQKSLKCYWFYMYFCKIVLSKLTSIFDPILVPTCLHFPSQILPKTEPRSHQFFDRFLDGFFIHFSSNLGPNLGPC